MFVGTVLLDTTVYIDTIQDRSPLEVESILQSATLLHSTIARSELVLAFGRLDPTDGRTSAALERIGKAIEYIPGYRLSVPSPRASLQAGIATGILSRLQGGSDDQRRRLFNDAQLFFQAHELGAHWLTANIVDADMLQQLFPAGRILLYRKI